MRRNGYFATFDVPSGRCEEAITYGGRFRCKSDEDIVVVIVSVRAVVLVLAV